MALMSDSNKHKSWRERREGADQAVKLMRFVGIVGWLGMFAALVILGKAQPENSFIDERFLSQFGYFVRLRSYWDMSLVRIIYFLMIMGLCLSLVALPVHLKRSRRHDDGYRIYLISLAVISLAGIIAYHYVVQV